jgi:ADP-ribosylglycohydrolase
MFLPIPVLESRLKDEINVRAQMGFVVDGMDVQWQSACSGRNALVALYDRLKRLPHRADWPYTEPSDLAAIRQERPTPIVLPHFYLSELEIKEKIHGAWLGRVAGCILGKPLEIGLSMENIQEYLAGADALPLADYIPSQSRSSTILRRDCAPSLRGLVSYAQEDDDLNYMCLAVKLLERKGLRFSTLDVGMNWLGSIPFLWTWGPEHVVYLNLAAAIGEHDPQDVNLEDVSTSFNPGVEGIGAQIRSDVYGYVCPGRPELAAEFAWRDAYFTHRANGLYGAMWVSAMNASAFTLVDMEQVVRAGLAQVPGNSRFTEAVHRVIDWCHANGDWQTTGRCIQEKYGHYGFEGVINNACCVTAALLYGWGDGSGTPAERFERAITIAVQLGFDTDCNGATVGSVTGLMVGAGLLPGKWISPLNDTLRTCVAEFGQGHISSIAQRTYEISRMVRVSPSV